MTYEEFKKIYPTHYRTQVNWGDMDAMEHVNNTVYFRYFENARIHLFEDLKAKAQGPQPSKVGLILASASCRYKRPLYYPDPIAIGIQISSLGEDRFTMSYYLWSEREQAIAAEGDSLIVSYDYEAKKKTSLPEAWRKVLKQG